MYGQFPVSGGADEQVAYVAAQISSDEAQKKSEISEGLQVWAVCDDGSTRFVDAVIESAEG